MSASGSRRRIRWSHKKAPPTATATASERAHGRVDVILSSGRCDDASVGFGVADPYRAIGEVFGVGPRAHTRIQRQCQEPNIFRASSSGRPPQEPPSVPVPLVKSHSAPVGLDRSSSSPSEMELMVKFGLVDAAAEAEAERAWACRGCGNTDTSKVSRNDDSSFVCEGCGVVDGQHTVSLHRLKNCAEAEDRTVVADAPRLQRGSGIEHMRTHRNHAVETALETRKRHLSASGGTCIPAAVAKRYQLSGAQSRVKTAVLQDARQRGAIDPAVERKLRPVLHAVEATFDHLMLNGHVEDYVTKSAIRVVDAAVRHARCCHGPHCQVSLASRPNRLLGVCIVQAALETLAASPDGVDCSADELRINVDRVKQLQLAGNGLNGGQRTMTITAVSIALGWTPQSADQPCSQRTAQPPTAPVPVSSSPGGQAASAPAPASAPAGAGAVGEPPSPMAPLPPAFALALAPGPAADGRSAQAVYTVRDRVMGAARLAQVSESVRRAALAAIQVPAVVDWIDQESAMPADILGVLVLAASAAKLGAAPAALTELRRSVCYEHSISPTTASAAEERLAPLLPAAARASLFDDAPADGLF